MSNVGPPASDEMVAARETIARQEEEIADLRRRLGEEEFAKELRAILTVAQIAGTMAAPVTHDDLLDTILQTACHVISARTGSLLRLDARSGELVFEAAVGEKGEELERSGKPTDEGIATLVAMTGQAMTVSASEEKSDERQEPGAGAGYRPASVLSVPLFYGEQVVGVLELMDKEGHGAFDPGDIELLGQLANLAGVAMEQSRRHQSLATLVEQIVQTLEGVSTEQRRGLLSQAREFAVRSEEDVVYGRALATAQLVHAISMHDADASSALQSILQAFAGYLQSIPRYSSVAAGR